MNYDVVEYGVIWYSIALRSQEVFIAHCEITDDDENE